MSDLDAPGGEVEPPTAQFEATAEILEAPADATGRSAFLVAAGIFLSRISGGVLAIAMAAFIGVGSAADAFRAAFRIPNLLQNLLGEGVLSAAFIPVYARLLAEGKKEEAGRVAGAIAGLLTALTGVIVLTVIVFAEPITTLLAPGFSGATRDLTVTLVQIMTAGIGFLVLSAWCLGILNTHRHFFLSYVAPVVWNVTQIVVVVYCGLRAWQPASTAEALAWGVTVGGVLQFLVQLPSVLRLERNLRLSVRTRLRGVRTVLRRFAPAVAGRGVIQLGAYADLVLASLLSTGAVAALGYAQILYLLPVSLFAMSVAAAELPELSRTDSQADHEMRLTLGLRRIAFPMMLTVVVYLAAGQVVVAALFEHRLFQADDTVLVWLILCGYSVGLLATGTSRMLQNLLFARGDTVGPAWIAAVRVTIAAALGFVLMFQFEQFAALVNGTVERVGDLPAPLKSIPESAVQPATVRLGAVGLALASGVASWIELALLRRRVRRTTSLRVPIAAPIVRLLPAAGASALVMLVVQIPIPAHLGTIAEVLSAAVVVGLGGLVYLGVSRLQGIPEASEMIAPIRRRLGR